MAAPQALIDAGADVSKRNKSGNSILDWAFLEGKMDIYHMILLSVSLRVILQLQYGSSGS